MTEPCIKVKNIDILDQLMNGIYHWKLLLIANFLIGKIAYYGAIPTITSAFRHGDKGVHGVGRGLDFRSREMTEDQINQICFDINSRWQYDPDRPEKVCLLFHDTGKGPHLHLQVHPNTTTIEGIPTA